MPRFWPHVNPFLPAPKWAPPKSVFPRRFLWIWTYARTLWLLIRPRNFEKNIFLVLFFCVQVFRTQVNYGNRKGMTRGECVRRPSPPAHIDGARKRPPTIRLGRKDPTYHCRFILWLQSLARADKMFGDSGSRGAGRGEARNPALRNEIF